MSLDLLSAITPVTDATFERDVIGSDRPVLVDFWAPWCGPCRRFLPVLEEIAQSHEKSLRVVKIEVEENPTTTAQHNVRMLPTLFLYHRGEIVATKQGSSGKEALLEWIERALPR